MQEIIEDHLGEGGPLIFCRTQVNFDTLVRELGKVGHSVYGLHGVKHKGTGLCHAVFRSGNRKY
ncbi:MAG: hypothetical protein CM1200mP35_08780 [Chloroflexota bacterium]|nr:MAG: hypothetical protein CM1200mP35_08780 [Chloroflexota bacterium]